MNHHALHPDYAEMGVFAGYGECDEETPANKLILIRGLPGSGKSTMAKRFCARGYLHVEADMFFLDHAGNYKFNALHLKDAHSWCQTTASRFLRAGYRVVVSNTFSRKWEIDPYLTMTPDYAIIEATGDYDNVHGFSEGVIEKMRERWETL